ncbi:MAG: SLC13 family permease [Phycisphaeraceae bacterium]|nr:SLC13 family permease [Phycisphaeraceae bacterium]
MSTMAIVVLAILAAAFVLFVGGWLAPDIVALLVLVALLLTGAVAPSEAFLGFSSNAVITIAGLMVIGAGLERTGVVKWVARRLEAVIRRRYHRLLLVNTGIPGMMSGFVNIVAAATFFIPVILRLCKKMKVPQSKILLPMACTALIGANLTLIGASHNLVVNSLLTESTGAGFTFFEFTPVGVVLLVGALLYILFIGQHLLPGEQEAPEPTEVPESPDLVEVYDLEDRLFELWVAELPPADADTVGELHADREYGLTLLTLVREGEQLLFPGADAPIEEGDMLLVQGREEVAQQFADDHAEITFLGPPESEQKYPLSTGELAEAVVPPRSPAVEKSVADLELTDRYGMTTLAVYRDGRAHRTGVQDMTLEEGDSLLLYGPRDKMREFDPAKELLVYFRPGKPEVSSRQKRLGPVAVAILVSVIAVAAVGLFPIAVTAVAGAVLTVLLGIVPATKIYDAIDWRSLVLIGGMYPLGVALDQSGAASAIGEGLVAGLGPLGPIAVLGGVVLLAMALTQPIHNAAVAIIMTPIAIDAARGMEADPKAFCVGVIVACSAAFLMPYGHPAPFLVQEPGGYGAGDYLKFGTGLAIIALAVILGVVPLIWPI